jgi:KUP system potassium uptake protein
MQDYTTSENLWMAYQALGVVFGDLGTSPLYVYPTIQLGDSPSEDDFLGVLSIIFWTMTLVSVIKYVFIVLEADDHGEGGTFAVYSLLCQYANIGPNAAVHATEMKSDMDLTNFSKYSRKTRKRRTSEFLEGNGTARRFLLVVVILGAALVFGDGVLTPAISVLSAIGGIQTEFPVVHQDVVIIISIVICLVLFGYQRFGTRIVSFTFSPIMALWCIQIFIIGLYNIIVYEPRVFKAASPHYIVLFFIHNHKSAWVALGGCVLCITGAEAMFADMGHFNKRSIQIAFLTMIYPSCMIAYAGETAYLIKNPGDHSNAFFASIPHGVFWPVFIISTLAAIVASQALISASFSVVKQAMALGCFPRVRLIHTSSHGEGQVYSPEVNYTIMLLCVIVIAGFQDANQIGNAFGVTVVCVMFITTCLMGLVMLIIWETPWYLLVSFLFIYGSIEGIYLTSVLYKFPQGGWVPFAISFFFGVIMLSWNYGNMKKVEFELESKLSTTGLATLLANSKIQRVPGICFFYTNLVHGIPPMISHYVKNVRTLHQVIVFTTIRYVPVVSVLPSERFLVSRVGYPGVYRCIARYGYMESISIEGNDFKELLLQSLRDYLQNPAAYQSRFSKEPFITEDGSEEQNPFVADEMQELAVAEKEEVVYVLGKTRLSLHKDASWWKKLVLDKLYALLSNNCRKSYDQLNIPPTNLLEVGMVYDIK